MESRKQPKDLAVTHLNIIGYRLTIQIYDRKPSRYSKNIIQFFFNIKLAYLRKIVADDTESCISDTGAGR